jgi:hypothetical protein
MNHRIKLSGSQKPQPTAPSSPASTNLWLAIGDETGQFKDASSSELHGVGIILARPAALTASLDEHLDGKTIRQRMNTCVPGLETWLLGQGSEKRKELKRHHVREAWKYLADERRLTGSFMLDDKAPEPVLAHLQSSFSWLASHSEIISLGLYGTGRELLTGFWKGSDEMAAIGALYGRLLGIVKPFLGSAARIRMLAGVRSEELDAKAIRRAGQSVGAPQPGSKRQSSAITGGSRTLLESMEREFWSTLSEAESCWPTPSTPAARQTTFACFTDDKALVLQLEREDKAAAKLVNEDNGALDNLADLTTSLMASSRNVIQRPLTIVFPEPIGPNVLFLPISEAVP